MEVFPAGRLNVRMTKKRYYGSRNNNDIVHKIPPHLPFTKGGITPL